MSLLLTSAAAAAAAAAAASPTCRGPLTKVKRKHDGHIAEFPDREDMELLRLDREREEMHRLVIVNRDPLALTAHPKLLLLLLFSSPKWY